MNNQRPHGSITTGLLKPITAALSIVALLAGCGSVETKDTVTKVASADKVVSVNVTEPSNGLLPSDTSDMSGWKIVSQLYCTTVWSHSTRKAMKHWSKPNRSRRMMTLPNTPSCSSRI